MNNSFIKTGGIRIANFNATWPFVRLILSPGKLKFNIFYFKNIEIYENEISSIKGYSILPLIGKGLKITLESNKKFGTFIMESDTIIFWFFGDANMVIKKIKDNLKKD